MSARTTTLPVRLLRLLLLASALVVLAGCGGDDAGEASSSGEERASLTLGTLRTPSPLALGQADGSLEENLGAKGVDVEFAGPFPALAPALAAMNSGDVDVAPGSITAAIGGLAGQADFSVFAYQSAANKKDTGIVARPAEGIREPADLRGKKVAVNRGGTGEYLLLKALDAGGLSRDDVEFVYLDPTDAASAFGAGRVDAWATFGNFTPLAREKYDAELVIAAQDIGSQNDNIFVVRTDVLKEQPEAVAELFAEIRSGAGRATANLAESVEETEKLNDVSPEVAEQLVRYSNGPVLPVDDATVKRYQTIADYFAEKDVTPKRVRIADHAVDVRTLPGGAAATR